MLGGKVSRRTEKVPFYVSSGAETRAETEEEPLFGVGRSRSSSKAIRKM